jgi:hypothetical protein
LKLIIYFLESLYGFYLFNCPDIMKPIKLLLFLVISCFSLPGFAQSAGEWKLEKMPADLETDFALSSLPPYIRAGASVYLLDPEKGYFLARTGTNSFICFVVRTDWERAVFRSDFATAISYDAEGAKVIFPVFADVAAMRATGKFTAAQIKDTIARRFSTGFYKAPSKPGLSYMLAPLMRSNTGPVGDTTIASFSLPHYMFYAPYVSAADIGGDAPDGRIMVLGDGKGAHGYIMVTAGKMEKAQILEDNKALLARLIAYKPYFQVGSEMHH